MKNILKISTVAATFLFASCTDKMPEEEIAQIGITPCRTQAPFVKKMGFNPSITAYSTTEKKQKGLVLLQIPKNPADTLGKIIWQDSSWKQFGFMGSITTDEPGNIYTAPIPMVNTLEVPTTEMNKIYKVDCNTAKMNLFCKLPKPDLTVEIVPFGVLGVYYDCHGKKLYAASVSGSTRDEEKGVIYVIDINTAKVVDLLKGYDAAGVFVGGTTGEKRLYFGSTRKPDIYSVELKKDGTFKNNKIKKELTLDQLGPRGNDKARRIRYDNAGNLIIHGVEFNYSLAAQSNKPETGYQFNYNEQEKKWDFVKLLN